MAAVYFPEQVKPVLLYHGAANAVDCDVVSTKNLNKVTFMVWHYGANDTDLVLSLYESDDVAKSTTAAITKTCPIYYISAASTSADTYTRATDAYSYTIDPATQGTCILLIEFDPAKLSEGYDCVYLADSGGNASNVVTIFAMCEMKHPKLSPLTVITD